MGPLDVLPHEFPPLWPPSRRPLPGLTYFVIVAGAYVLLGSVAQFRFLPLGIWWSQLFLFVVPTLLVLRARGFRPLAFLRFDRLPASRQLAPAAGVAVAVYFSASALMAACEEAAPPQWVQRFDISRLLGTVHGPWQAVLFASVIVGAPIAEETVFRGYLQPALAARIGLWRAILAQAVLFSFVHLDPVGFFPRLLLGVAFGQLVALTGSIWSSVFAHALNNGISTVLFFRVWARAQGGGRSRGSPLGAALLRTRGARGLRIAHVAAPRDRAGASRPDRRRPCARRAAAAAALAPRVRRLGGGHVRLPRRARALGAPPAETLTGPDRPAVAEGPPAV